MPLFSYLCDSCGHEEERLEKADVAATFTCGKCGKGTMARKMSAFGVGVAAPKMESPCASGSCASGGCPFSGQCG